jgi:hypothetical protein
LKSTTRIVILWTVRRRRPANELRIAIDCLPLKSREAMLDGIDSNRIIVGAYTDRQGGVCPMLAAHRKGGRTSLASFARAWDRYTRAGNGPRPASERELLTLRTMLEASIAIDSGVDEDLKDLVAKHKARKARNGHGNGNGRPVPTGETDRTEELRHRHGWAWLRLFRRYDAYELALEQLHEAEQKAEEDATERLPVG